MSATHSPTGRDLDLVEGSEQFSTADSTVAIVPSAEIETDGGA